LDIDNEKRSRRRKKTRGKGREKKSGFHPKIDILFAVMSIDALEYFKTAKVL
jgi:hypothetical protein